MREQRSLAGRFTIQELTKAEYDAKIKAIMKLARRVK